MSVEYVECDRRDVCVIADIICVSANENDVGYYLDTTSNQRIQDVPRIDGAAIIIAVR